MFKCNQKFLPALAFLMLYCSQTFASQLHCIKDEKKGNRREILITYEENKTANVQFKDSRADFHLDITFKGFKNCEPFPNSDTCLSESSHLEILTFADQIYVEVIKRTGQSSPQWGAQFRANLSEGLVPDDSGEIDGCELRN